MNLVYEDSDQRFYTGSPVGKCSECGSLGSLFHFLDRQDICPFCVIRLAREPLLNALAEINVETGMYAGALPGSRDDHVAHIHEIVKAASRLPDTEEQP